MKMTSILLLLLTQVSSSPTLDEPFESSQFTSLKHAPCVSLYHANGRVGCGTISRSIQSGTILHWSALLSSSIEKDYVAVISDVDYTYENINSIMNGNVKGVLIVNTTDEGDITNGASIYPHGMNTPEEYTTLYKETAWNANGDGMLYNNMYGLPSAYIQDYDISTYLTTLSKEDSESSDVVADFNYYMGPEGTSKECLEWKNADGSWSPKCLPLGGSSVWALLNNNDKEIVWITAAMDATSMFHDIVPGLNTAAVNVLILLMVARILGELDEELEKNIGIALFQGESYGYLGSRNFFSEYNNFNCENYAAEGCLYPLRPSLDFTNLGGIAGIVSLDQLGYVEDGLYVHGTGGFVDNVLLALSSDDLTVQQSSVQDIPPSPLATAITILGDMDGSVLTGYDDTFHPSYMSHFDNYTIDLDRICQTATLIARAAVALAYDDGSQDSDSASQYALTLIPDVLTFDDTSADLRDCLFYNGNCDLFVSYANMERVNRYLKTGKDWGIGTLLGKPPNYYVSVLDAYNSQPFVSIGNKYYGAYTGGEYGNTTTDAFLHRPTVLESSIFGLFNHFLTSVETVSCESYKDCNELDCGEYAGTCTGAKVCTCPKARYHLALDTNLQATKDEFMGHFSILDDNAVTPMYTEPYWSSDVGVTIYRKMDSSIGWILLSVGIVFAAGSVVAAFFIRRYMFKHKLY